MLKTRFFVEFCKILLKDFRRFSRIFANFIIFAHGSDRFQHANCFQMRSFSWILVDPSNFQMKIHNISALGAQCYRNVARSAPDVKITLFLQTVTWAWSKRNSSSIFVGYSSRIFDDFHGFSYISSFLRIVMNALRKQIASKTVHFLDFIWIRAIFG